MIWTRDSSHKIRNKYFIDHCQGWKEGLFVCETVWYFTQGNTHPFDLKYVAFGPKFSGYSYVDFQEKSISGEFFKKLLKFRPTLCNFYCVCIALKKFTQVLSYVICTPVRRHVHKWITKRRYGGENPRRFVFEKPVLFILGLGLTTPYSLCVFGLNFLPDVFHFVYWVLAMIWALDSSHKIGNKHFIDHCQGWKEGSFVCETVWLFSWVNTHLFYLKFVAFGPKLNGYSYVEFQEKLFREIFSEIFVQTKVIVYQNLCNSALLYAIFILRMYSLLTIHASTFIFCFHAGKEARP